jgi:hypothetical protein
LSTPLSVPDPPFFYVRASKRGERSGHHHDDGQLDRCESVTTRSSARAKNEYFANP